MKWIGEVNIKESLEVDYESQVLKIIKVTDQDITEVNSLKAGVRLNNNFSFSNVSWGK
jgi:hypothetical protein